MFQVRYDRRVRGDVALLTKVIRVRVKRAIEDKLASKPEVFGKPLRQSLIGFRSLRVGDYRVIYKIESEDEVFVVLIAHRKDAYIQAEKRSK